MLCIYRKNMLCIHLFPLSWTSLSPPALSGATARGQQRRVPSGAVMIRYPHPARLPLPIYHHFYCAQLPSFGGQSCPDLQPGRRLFKANIFAVCLPTAPGNPARVFSPQSWDKSPASSSQEASHRATSSPVMGS